MRATELNKTLLELDARQLRAVPLVVAGQRDEDIAKEVGVSRSTVSRWRNHHPGFKAAVNQAKYDLWQSCNDGIEDLLHIAMDRLREEIRSESPRGAKYAWQFVNAVLIERRVECAPAGSRSPVEILANMNLDDQQTLDELAKLFAERPVEADGDVGGRALPTDIASGKGRAGKKDERDSIHEVPHDSSPS